MSKLYEINQKLLYLQDLMENELIDEETFNDTLESIDLEFEDKAEGYAIIMTQLGDEADALDKEIKRLTAKKKTINNNCDRLKKALFDSMEVTGKPKFKTKLFNFTIRNNAPSVLITDETAIPAKYFVAQPSKLVKKDLLKDLKELEEGKEIEGATLQRTKSLIIK